VQMKLASPSTLIVLLAGTIPVLTFVVERWVTHRYIDPALAAAGVAPGAAAAPSASGEPAAQPAAQPSAQQGPS
jgi:hypothetical protein